MYCGDGGIVDGAEVGDGVSMYCGDGGIVDGANDGAAVLGIGVGALLGENVGDGGLTAGIVSDMMSPVAELHVGVVKLDET
jgi:hypothetical protein